MFMYLLNFLIGFIFMLPGGIVWVLNGNLNVLQIILYFTSVIFVPLIPMCIAACMGYPYFGSLATSFNTPNQ